MNSNQNKEGNSIINIIHNNPYSYHLNILDIDLKNLNSPENQSRVLEQNFATQNFRDGLEELPNDEKNQVMHLHKISLSSSCINQMDDSMCDGRISGLSKGLKELGVQVSWQKK